MDRKQLAESIKARVNIVDVVGRYVQLTRAGNNHKGLCPFHNEATPSFLVSEDKGIYKCFGCGEGGDAISFISKMESISYSESLMKLAEESGIDNSIVRQLKRSNAANNFEKEFEILKFVQGFYQYYLLNTEEGKLALEYLANRGISKEIIQQFGIGLAPRDGNLLIKALEANSYSFEIARSSGIIGQSDQGDYYSRFKSRIMFSVANESGNVVGFSGRTYLPDDDNQAKYVNSPESRIFQKSQIAYNIHEARKIARTSGRMLIFEGFMDVIAAYKAGFKEVIATMGTALTAEHAKLLRRHAREVIIVFDGDKAGLLAISKAIPILLSTGLQVRVAVMSAGLDPDDFIKQNGIEKFANLINNPLGAMDFQYEYLKQGISLDTTDGQVEFERRLTTFGNSLSDRTLLQVLLRKLKDEIYKRRRISFNNPQTKAGLYRHQQGQSSILSVAPKLQVVAGEVKAEKELIYYMLREKRVFELVLLRIGTAFNIDVHRKIVQAIEAYYFKNDVLNQEDFFSQLEPELRRVAQEIVYGLRSRPEEWTKTMIVDLTNRIQKGAMKLERAGKKERFYSASYEQQLELMSDLTADRLH